jgi:predicted RNA-binding protein YlqC (UPF0109 family)
VTEEGRDLIEYVGRYLLDYPRQMDLEVDRENGTTVYRLDVHEKDRGKIIGKGGRTAQALRSVIRASGALSDEQFQLEIVD